MLFMDSTYPLLKDGATSLDESISAATQPESWSIRECEAAPQKQNSILKHQFII